MGTFKKGLTFHSCIRTEECSDHKYIPWWIFTSWADPCSQQVDQEIEHCQCEVFFSSWHWTPGVFPNTVSAAPARCPTVRSNSDTTYQNQRHMESGLHRFNGSRPQDDPQLGCQLQVSVDLTSVLLGYKVRDFETCLTPIWQFARTTHRPQKSPLYLSFPSYSLSLTFLYFHYKIE